MRGACQKKKNKENNKNQNLTERLCHTPTPKRKRSREDELELIPGDLKPQSLLLDGRHPEGVTPRHLNCLNFVTFWVRFSAINLQDLIIV